jgi:hypothetical protein
LVQGRCKRTGRAKAPGDHGAHNKELTMVAQTGLFKLLAASALTLGLTGAASAAVWTSIGSAGAIDDADLGILDVVANAIEITAAAPAGSSLLARYNIVQLSGLSGAGNYRLRTLFKDAGVNSQVRVTLYELNLTTGALASLDTFDSNAEPAAVGYQSADHCIFGINLNFNINAYYLLAQLTKSAVAGDPGLGGLQLKKNC